jgi:hypothetical protein
LKCRGLALDASGTEIFTVHVIANYTALEEKDLAVGDTLAIEPEAVKYVTLEGLTGFNAVPISDVEVGTYHFAGQSPAKAGYLPSSAVAPIQFSPEVGTVVERVAG